MHKTCSILLLIKRTTVIMRLELASSTRVDVQSTTHKSWSYQIRNQNNWPPHAPHYQARNSTTQTSEHPTRGFGATPAYNNVNQASPTHGTVCFGDCLGPIQGKQWPNPVKQARQSYLTTHRTCKDSECHCPWGLWHPLPQSQQCSAKKKSC